MENLVVILIFILIFLVIPAGRKVIVFIFGAPYFGLKHLNEWIEGHMKEIVKEKETNPKKYKRHTVFYSNLYSFAGSLCKLYEKLYDSLSK